jgi:hypothetical protein
MDPLGIALHLLNFALPALLVAGLLAPAVVGLRGPARGGRAWRRFWGAWLALALCGLTVLVAGLVLFGRDGKMATYGALVLVTGSMAWWLHGRGR